MTRLEWADALCDELQITRSGAARRALTAWIQSEGSQAPWNPLATTQPMPGSVPWNSVGVQGYISADQGIEATAKTLAYRHQHYAAIVGRLSRQAAPEKIIEAIGSSEWGTDYPLLVAVLADVRRTWPDLSERSIPE